MRLIILWIEIIFKNKKWFEIQFYSYYYHRLGNYDVHANNHRSYEDNHDDDDDGGDRAKIKGIEARDYNDNQKDDDVDNFHSLRIHEIIL